jgi:uncharacterized protein with PQ loop repeat
MVEKKSKLKRYFYILCGASISMPVMILLHYACGLHSFYTIVENIGASEISGELLALSYIAESINSGIMGLVVISGQLAIIIVLLWKIFVFTEIYIEKEKRSTKQ